MKAHLVTISGASGGIGASSLACALAMAAVESGWRAAAVDGHPVRGGLDVTAGVEHLLGHRWHDYAQAAGRIDPATILDALPGDRVAVLAGSRRGLGNADGRRGSPADDVGLEARESVLRALLEASDLVVIDLPLSQVTAWEPTLAALGELALVTHLMVGGVLARHVHDALTLATTMQPERGWNALVTFGPRDQKATGEHLAQACDLPWWGHLACDARVARAQERGEWPGRSRRSSLGTFAESLIERVQELPRASSPIARLTSPVDKIPGGRQASPPTPTSLAGASITPPSRGALVAGSDPGGQGRAA